MAKLPGRYCKNMFRLKTMKLLIYSTRQDGKWNTKIIQLSQKSWYGFTPPRSPDLTPMDFYSWAYAKHIVYDFSTHQCSTLETANQGNCCICHSWYSWSNAAGNAIPLRRLQSHQCSPHVTSINMQRKLFQLLFNVIRNLMHVSYSL
jgi:hypothetical protein